MFSSFHTRKFLFGAFAAGCLTLAGCATKGGDSPYTGGDFIKSASQELSSAFTMNESVNFDKAFAAGKDLIADLGYQLVNQSTETEQQADGGTARVGKLEAKTPAGENIVLTFIEEQLGQTKIGVLLDDMSNNELLQQLVSGLQQRLASPTGTGASSPSATFDVGAAAGN
ncbi:MAG: hypothetical protein RLY93_19800 [Sumerlaeia bacterium]